MSNEIPKEVREIIDQYKSLDIAGQKVPTPYYRNVKRVRAELRSLAGKGTPEEIAEETVIYSKLRGLNLDESSTKQIREFMQEQGIGIDCSGFVSHILNTWLRVTGKGSLYGNLKFPSSSIYRRIIRAFRPIENVAAELLTNLENCIKVELKDVQIGDLIRLKGIESGHHIAIIIDIEREQGSVKSIQYVHSSEQYGDENGVKTGIIKVKDQNGELIDQEWLERDKDGVCWTLKQLEREYADNGLRRPNFFINNG